MFGSSVKRGALGKILLFGSISLALYGAVFAYAEPLTSLFAKGGAYCVLPVITIFVVSFFHAAFAGSIWAALGIAPVVRQPAREKAVSLSRQPGNNRMAGKAER